MLYFSTTSVLYFSAHGISWLCLFSHSVLLGHLFTSGARELICCLALPVGSITCWFNNWIAYLVLQIGRLFPFPICIDAETMLFIVSAEKSIRITSNTMQNIVLDAKNGDKRLFLASTDVLYR
jgi:hypothetical protein